MNTLKGEGNKTTSAPPLSSFNAIEIESVNRTSVLAYKHLESYLGEQTRPLDLLLGDVLGGMSRLVGSPGFRGSGLAIAGTDRNSATAVIKVISKESFILDRPKVESDYVESFDDLLVLKHESGAELLITLDLYELIMRAASGEIFNSAGASSLIQDLEMFTAQLRRQPSQEVFIYNESGEPIHAEKLNNNIVLSVGSK